MKPRQRIGGRAGAQLLETHATVLELAAQGAPLQRSLDLLLRAIEDQGQGMLCSILLLESGRLRHVAAPSLPEPYKRSIEGVRIGPGVGSCGTAAYRGEPVIVEDIATDPLWAPYRQLAMPYGLRACWSTPIVDGRRQVIGTFASYFRSPATPSAWHRELIDLTSQTAAFVIVQRREMEEARRRQAQLEEAQRIAQLGSYEWDTRSDITRGSGELCRILGLSPGDLEPTLDAYFERVHPVDRPGLRAIVEDSMRSRAPFDIEARIVRPGGEVRWVRNRGRWIVDEQGSPLSLIGTVQDVTDGRRTGPGAERPARHDEFDAFVAMVSHDLKAPLRSMVGQAGELRHHYAGVLDERGRQCLESIVTGTHNLERLVEDLLRYCRADGEPPSETAVDLPETVAAILGDRWPSRDRRPVQVSVDFAVTRVVTWPRGLVQILTNLLDNAVKYSRDADPPRVTIASRDLPHAVRLSVADNGIGFDMKHHERIFGLFNRLAGQGAVEGTGVGLAIVKRIAQRMGASVWAESAAGRGATFFVDLPKHQPGQVA